VRQTAQRDEVYLRALEAVCWLIHRAIPFPCVPDPTIPPCIPPVRILKAAAPRRRWDPPCAGRCHRHDSSTAALCAPVPRHARPRPQRSQPQTDRPHVLRCTPRRSQSSAGPEPRIVRRGPRPSHWYVTPLFAHKEAAFVPALRSPRRALTACGDPFALARLKEAWGQAQRSNALLFHHDFWQSRTQVQKIHLLPARLVLPRRPLTPIAAEFAKSPHLAVRPHPAPPLPLYALSCSSPHPPLRTGACFYTTRKYAASRKRQLEEDILQRI
jgi:hypothetical protein